MQSVDRCLKDMWGCYRQSSRPEGRQSTLYPACGRCSMSSPSCQQPRQRSESPHSCTTASFPAKALPPHSPCLSLSHTSPWTPPACQASSIASNPLPAPPKLSLRQTPAPQHLMPLPTCQPQPLSNPRQPPLHITPLRSPQNPTLLLQAAFNPQAAPPYSWGPQHCHPLAPQCSLRGG